MNESYQIKDPDELADYLKQFGRDAVLDCDYQLQTNLGFVHELENGQVAFFDNHFNKKAILFSSKKYFDDIIKADRFPIENPENDMFDVDGDSMLTFHLQANHYRQHLNNILKFDFPEITKDAAQTYLKKVIGRSIKRVTKPTDIIALISVIGELVKMETNGKWFLVKRYGTYNPFYEPNLVTADGNVLLVSDNVVGSIKWRVSSLDNIFIHFHSKLLEPIEWKRYAEGRNDLIELE
jgi:hypothetical protein